MPDATNYDLKSVKLPRLSGIALSLAARALGIGPLRALLLPSMLESGGISAFRGLAPEEPITPLPFPSLPAPAGTGPGEERRIPGPRGAPSAAAGAFSSGRPSAGPYRSAFDYERAYREGRADPESVARRALEAIARSDEGEPKLRAFIAVREDEVMRQAAESAERWKAGRPLGPLDGVPVAVKDEVDLAPYPTTAGTTFLGRAPAREDATSAARLRAAGALMLGKANMHEIGINPDCLNAHYGSARNPHDLGRDAGGSSSGPAAATAAGLCPLSLAADGGGSIRVPAAHCGLVGLKPTFGRVSERGAAPLCWSVAHLGPIAATAADAALGLSIMAGPDPLDPNSLHQPPLRLDGLGDADLRGVRLGVYRPWFEHAEPDIVGACSALLDGLAAAGAEVKEVVVPGLDDMRVAHAITILAEMAASMANFPDHAGEFGAEVRVSLGLARAFDAGDYIKAQRIRTRAMAAFRSLFDEVDAIVTPSTGIVAPAIPPKDAARGWSDLSATTEVMRFAFPGNLTGLPAISFPAGFDRRGLPIGMQAMGRWWDEGLLLRVASVAEGLVERRRPAMFFELY